MPTKFSCLLALVAACSSTPRRIHYTSDAGSEPGLASDASVADAGLDTKPALAQVDTGAVRAQLRAGYLRDARDGWLTLVAVDWQLEPGAETYVCGRLTADSDAYVNEFTGLMSPGTHHTVLFDEGEPAREQGVVPCEVDRTGAQIFDSNDFTAGVPAHRELPAGIAMSIPKGQGLMVNIHLLNSSAERLYGSSGVLVRAVMHEQVRDLAQVLEVGPDRLSVPPGSVTLRARCAWPREATVFNVTPHMHEMGSYIKVIASSARGDQVLLDSRFDFDYQHVYVVDFTVLQGGDESVLECTYQNRSFTTAGFGYTAHDEMCLAALSVFPPLADAALPCSVE